MSNSGSDGSGRSRGARSTDQDHGRQVPTPLIATSFPVRAPEKNPTDRRAASRGAESGTSAPKGTGGIGKAGPSPLGPPGIVRRIEGGDDFSTLPADRWPSQAVPVLRRRGPRQRRRSDLKAAASEPYFRWSNDRPPCGTPHRAVVPGSDSAQPRSPSVSRRAERSDHLRISVQAGATLNGGGSRTSPSTPSGHPAPTRPPSKPDPRTATSADCLSDSRPGVVERYILARHPSPSPPAGASTLSISATSPLRTRGRRPPGVRWPWCSRRRSSPDPRHPSRTRRPRPAACSRRRIPSPMRRWIAAGSPAAAGFGPDLDWAGGLPRSPGLAANRIAAASSSHPPPRLGARTRMSSGRTCCSSTSHRNRSTTRPRRS